MVYQSPAGQVATSFAELLRQLRVEARLTQEELAEAACLSPRSISDLERGISRTARKETAFLLADALSIGGSVRSAFVAAARGRAPITDVLAARDSSAAEAPAATMVWYASDDEGLSTHKTKLIRLIDAMTAAAVREGNAITGIWLIALTASAASETTSCPPETGLGAAPSEADRRPPLTSEVNPMHLAGLPGSRARPRRRQSAQRLPSRQDCARAAPSPR